MRLETGPFSNKVYALTHAMVHKAVPVDVGEWQSIDISDKPEMKTRELFDVTVKQPIADTTAQWAATIDPNLPWAEDHFQERVSGEPLNPPPSHKWWPFNKQNEIFQKDEKFSHTYPERFWPKFANEGETRSNGRQVFVPHNGVRYEYGDLMDVVKLLRKSPLTRQAYLPVWFPEDTGAHHGERVPCTLGYHFIIRGGALHCIYYIRSCDFLRHFRDDVYLAGRLAQWLAQGINVALKPGNLTMHMTSLHVFEGDMPMLRSKLETNT